MINTSTSAISAREAYALLDWYQSMGVDEAIDSTAIPKAGWAPSALENVPPIVAPHDNTLPFTPAPAAIRTAPPRPMQGQAEAMAEARALAAAATTLEELREAVMGFHGCSLRKTAMNTVFADGNPQARVMLIGEAPGAEEDKKGIPFCGASGQLLDKMLAAIGLTRTGDTGHSFYISNTLFWRPPGNRQPTPEEVEICRPFVEKHIALINPSILVAVGGTATKALLHETRGITRLRGQVLAYTNDAITTPIPTHILYHPSFLLRQPAAKRQAWGDLLQLKQALLIT